MGILVAYNTIPLGSALFDPSMLSHGPSVMKPVSHLHVLRLSQSPKFLRVGVTQKTNNTLVMVSYCTQKVKGDYFVLVLN